VFIEFLVFLQLLQKHNQLIFDHSYGMKRNLQAIPAQCNDLTKNKMFVFGINIAIKFGNTVLSSVIVLSDMVISVFLVVLKTDRHTRVVE